MSIFSAIGKGISSITGSDVFKELAGPVVGGLFGMHGAQQQNADANAASARQMAFQERMSSTAHQREVQDLIKAGLNPILSAGGSGAVSGAGSTYAPVSEAGAAMSSASSVHQMRNLRMQNHLLKEQAEQSYSAAQLQKMQAALVPYDMNVRKATERLYQQQFETERHRTEEQRWMADMAHSTAKGVKIEGDIDDSFYGEMTRRAQRLNPLRFLIKPR